VLEEEKQIYNLGLLWLGEYFELWDFGKLGQSLKVSICKIESSRRKKTLVDRINIK
jgi:hypothetical protein